MPTFRPLSPEEEEQLVPIEQPQMQGAFRPLTPDEEQGLIPATQAGTGYGVAEGARDARAATVATGALAGTAVGARAATAAAATRAAAAAVPHPVGKLALAGVGSALGTAAGAALYENALDALYQMGVQGVRPPPDMKERTDEIAKEATWDAAFTVLMGGGPRQAWTLFREGRHGVANFLGMTKEAAESARALDAETSIHGWARLFGVKEEGVSMAQKAEDLQVPLGISQTTSGPIAGFWSKVFARFPFVGGPARRRAFEAQEASIAAKDRLFAQMGPSANLADLGVDMHKAVDYRFKAFRDSINREYNAIHEMARRTNATIPGTQLKAAAAEYRAVIEETYGGLPKGHPVDNFLKRVEELPDEVSWGRFRGLSQQLDEAMNMGRLSGADVAMLTAWKKDVMENALGKVSNPQVREALKKADARMYRVMTDVFETPTAQRFGRFEKNRFGIGFSEQGTRYPDEAFNIVFQQQRNSPQAMRDLRELINTSAKGAAHGDDLFGSAVRGYFDDVYTKAVQKMPDGNYVFSLQHLRKGFGLDNKTGPMYRALETALEGTGTNMRQIENLVDVMGATLRNAPDDVNSFIARRGTLGGRQAILNGLLGGMTTGGGGAAAGAAVGAGAVPGLISGATFIIASRSFGKLLSSPDVLKAGIQALDPALPLASRRVAFHYMVNMLADDPSADYPEKVAQVLGLNEPEEESDGLTAPFVLESPERGKVKRYPSPQGYLDVTRDDESGRLNFNRTPPWYAQQ